MDKRRGTRFGRFGVVPLAVVLGVLAAACGSGSSGTAAKAPAGAKENATAYTGSAVCYDLYRSGVQVPCAENTVGPGGGVIFYDAGSVQAWGRFLEVAPWSWNPQLPPFEGYACYGGCGANTTSVLKPTLDRTQDIGTNEKSNTSEVGDGYTLCSRGADMPLTYDHAPYGTAVGAGRANTQLLLQVSGCSRLAGDQANTGAVALVVNFRGGGRDDWFLPSKDELDLLYRFGNRDAIGGFQSVETPPYVSSTVQYVGNRCNSSYRQGNSAWALEFDTGAMEEYICVSYLIDYWGWTKTWLTKFSVRPIRAFS